MHAVAEYLLNFKVKVLNGTMVVLGVNDIFELDKIMSKISWKGLDFAQFYEPDIGNQLTALACVTDTNIFNKLRLV